MARMLYGLIVVFSCYKTSFTIRELGRLVACHAWASTTLGTLQVLVNSLISLLNGETDTAQHTIPDPF